MILINDSLNNFAIRVSKFFFTLDTNVYLKTDKHMMVNKTAYYSDDNYFVLRFMNEMSKSYNILNTVLGFEIKASDKIKVKAGVKYGLEINRSFFTIKEFNNENFIFYNVLWGFLYEYVYSG